MSEPIVTLPTNPDNGRGRVCIDGNSDVPDGPCEWCGCKGECEAKRLQRQALESLTQL